MKTQDTLRIAAASMAALISAPYPGVRLPAVRPPAQRAPKRFRKESEVERRARQEAARAAKAARKAGR